MTNKHKCLNNLGNSLVRWKNSKYSDENILGPKPPELTDKMQTPEFIIDDETNAEVMKKLKIKW